jgi:hypothetical protein
VYHDPPPTTRVNTPTVRLWDPAGTLHQGCAGGPCDETVTDPVPGIWRVSYDGAGTNRVDVAVVLSDALPRVWLQNPWRPVYAAVHGGSSAADRVVLPEGTYGLLFEVYAADASQPVPHVRLLDPAGQEAASCASRYCRVHPGGAAPGGWGVVSEGDGRIEVRLWVMVRQAA